MKIKLYYLPNTQGNDSVSSTNWTAFGRGVAGSMATWVAFMYYLERKYLPSLMDTSPMESQTPAYHSRLLATPLFWEQEKNYLMEEIWDLQLSPELTTAERITLLSMMDGAYFTINNLAVVVAAWKEVAAELNETSQAAFARLAMECKNLMENVPDAYMIAVNWSDQSYFKSKFETGTYFNVVEASETLVLPNL